MPTRGNYIGLDILEAISCEEPLGKDMILFISTEKLLTAFSFGGVKLYLSYHKDPFSYKAIVFQF